MIRRVLVAISDVSGVDPLHRCLASLPDSRTALVTVVSTISTSAWTSGLPDLISAGTGARLLEMQPWETAARSVAQLMEAFSARCAADGVRCRVEPPEADPTDSVVRACRLNDLLIAGSPPHIDEEGERMLARAMDCSGIPVLRSGPAPDTVSRVLVVLSDDAASFRALRAFVTLSPWPAAATTVSVVGLEPEFAERAAGYSANHSLEATPLGQDFRHRSDALAWASREGIDAVVTGWHKSPRFRMNADTIPVFFLAR